MLRLGWLAATHARPNRTKVRVSAVAYLERFGLERAAESTCAIPAAATSYGTGCEPARRSAPVDKFGIELTAKLVRNSTARCDPRTL